MLLKLGNRELRVSDVFAKYLETPIEEGVQGLELQERKASIVPFILIPDSLPTDPISRRVEFKLLGDPDGPEVCWDLRQLIRGDMEEVTTAYIELVKSLEGTGLHIANKIVIDNRSGSTENILFIRFFEDGQWPCKGHPEMLIGAPLGQYHCEECGEMQIAGLFHLPKDVHMISMEQLSSGKVEL